MKHFHFETGLAEQLGGVEGKKYVKRIKIVKLLYKEGAQTTAALCKKLRVSAPNMIVFLNEMVESNIIEKKGHGESKGGRKPELYGLVAGAFYVMGVEMGIYKTRLALFNANNERLTEVEEYSIVLNNEKHTLELIVETINLYIKQSGIDKKKILGIGFSMPGLVDSAKGVNYTYLHYKGKSIASLLEEKTGCPVFIENDAKAIALAEFRLGCARGKKDVLVLYLDWGIGLGMILDGKLFRGSCGFAGEFSHIPMVENGSLCRCGKLGCIETVASGIRILELAEQGIEKKKTSIVFDDNQRSHQYLGLKNVIRAALEGDQYAIKILEETGYSLGKGIAILIQLFNPELIVLSGKLSESGELITVPIQQGIKAHAMKQISEKTKIEITGFGADIGMFGALAVIIENVFNNYSE